MTTTIDTYAGDLPDNAGCIELAEYMERRRRYGLEGDE